MKKSIYTKFLAPILYFLVLFSLHTKGTAQTGEWKLWVKISPCSGRFDWISVAKEDPAATSGNSYYFPADFIFPGAPCNQGCTFLEASNIRDSLRKSTEFFKYCCRDYSVWKNVHTGKMTVLLDKGPTPGEGWLFVKGNLCCEEAEAMAGIPGACSGHQPNQPALNIECPPETVLKYNPVTKQNECVCKDGLVWNSTKTACIDPKKIQRRATGEWKVWVKTSPCSGRSDWLSVAKESPGMTSGNNYYSVANAIFPDVPCTIYGCTFEEASRVRDSLQPSPQFFQYCCRDYSVWKNIHTGKMTVLLDRGSTPGEGWIFVKGNLCCEEAEAQAGIPGACSAKTDNLPFKCPTGSYLKWNPEKSKNECDCKEGLVWNKKRTACVEPQVLVKETDCSEYPGAVAVWNKESKKVECDCPTGKVWNNSRTACVTKTTTTPTTKAGAGSWTLVSVTTVPVTPGEGWNFNIQGGTANRVIYDGGKASYQWTPPPQQFDGSGFTMSVSVTATPAPNSTNSSVIDVGASGLTSDKPKEQSAYARSPGGTASNSFTFKPTGYSEVEVWVVLNWGSVKCYYKYKRN